MSHKTLFALAAGMLLSVCTPLRAATNTYSDKITNVKVNAITQDKDGYMWFATRHGLNRYNGSNYRTFYASTIDGNLSNDYIYDVIGDRNGNIWVGTKSGLYVYDGTGFVVPNRNTVFNPCMRVIDYDDEHVIATGNNGVVKFRKEALLEGTGNAVAAGYNEQGCSWISNIVVTSLGDIWAAVSQDDKTFVYILDKDLNLLEKKQVKGSMILSICSEINNAVWVSTNAGTTAYDMTSRQKIEIPEKAAKVTENAYIHFIKRYGEHGVLIGRLDAGLYIYDFRSGDLRHVHKEQNLSSYHYVAEVDRDLNIWLSDNISAPVCYPSDAIYQHYIPFGGNSDYIHQIAVNEDGTLFLNSEFASYTYELGSDQTTQYSRIKGNLTNQYYDFSTDDIFVSSGQNELFRFSTDGNPVTLLKTYRFNQNILGIGGDLEGNVWIFASDKKVYHITPEDEVIDLGSLDAINDFTVPIIDYGDRSTYITTTRGATYQCTNDGLVLRHFPGSLSCILTASDGTKWFGTFDKGLVHFFPETGEEIRYDETNKIGDSAIKSILEDNCGNIWFATSQNINKYDVKADSFTMIHDSGFNENCYYEIGCAFKDRDGNLYFGGDGGLTFIPAGNVSSTISTDGLPLVLEQFNINRQEAKPESGLRLKFSQRNVSFRYAVLQYGAGTRMNYAYKLDGKDRDWILTPDNSAIYENLKPGKYTFHAKVRKFNGEWDENEITYSFRILHAWYNSHLATILYLLLTGAMVFLLIWAAARARTQQERLSLSLEREKMKQDQMDFLTNISHEFRTPLSLLYGPLKQLSRKASLDSSDLTTIQMMEKNASRLTEISEKILTASDAQTKDKVMRVSLTDMANFTKEICETFRYTSSEKDIAFNYDIPSDMASAYIDKEKVEKILFNLLSNAFKYTPEHGKVSLALKTTSDKAIFTVTDNGVGIDRDKRSQIFERFERLGAEMTSIQGSGIGLNYAQSLAHIHRGKIAYSPAEGGGSVFTLSVPCSRDAFSDNEIQEIGTIRKEAPASAQKQTETEALATLRNIVLAEDNADVRFYLKSLLSPYYNVTTCSDGVEALDYIRTIVPDLIVSDVMMPNMDGFTLCHQVKADDEVSHIPFVLLTAKTDIKSSIKGLGEGAEAYIPKPFDPDYLIATIKTLLDNRAKIQDRLLNLTSTTLAEALKGNDTAAQASEEDGSSIAGKGQPSEVLQISEKDRRFLEKIHLIIEENLSEESFNIDSLTREIGMSYSVLYGRVKALTGHSPKTFIETYRMNKAMEMIKAGETSVSEIAAAVGASSPSNFARSFKKQFDITPTEAMKLPRDK